MSFCEWSRDFIKVFEIVVGMILFTDLVQSCECPVATFFEIYHRIWFQFFVVSHANLDFRKAAQIIFSLILFFQVCADLNKWDTKGCIAAILNPLPIMPSKLSSPTLMTYSTKMFLDEWLRQWIAWLFTWLHFQACFFFSMDSI